MVLANLQAGTVSVMTNIDGRTEIARPDLTRPVKAQTDRTATLSVFSLQCVLSGHDRGLVCLTALSISPVFIGLCPPLNLPVSTRVVSYLHFLTALVLFKHYFTTVYTNNPQIILGKFSVTGDLVMRVPLHSAVNLSAVKIRLLLWLLLSICNRY